MCQKSSPFPSQNSSNQREKSEKKNNRGFILIATIALIALLAMVSTVTVLTVTTDIKTSNNYMTNVQAFYDAEAGVKYTMFRVEQDV